MGGSDDASKAFMNRDLPVLTQLLNEKLGETTKVGDSSITLDPDIGFRAAWLLALADMERTYTAGVRQQVTAQPRLAKSSAGTELLARAALADGREEEARRLYHRMATNSFEARTYLARQAFAARD